MMEEMILLLVLLPLAGFVSSLFVPKRNEKSLAFIGLSAAAIYLVLALVQLVLWGRHGFAPQLARHWVLYKTNDFVFKLDYFWDYISCVFAIMGGLMILLILQFSRFYLHRDEGFKRFFVLILLFFSGYNLVVLSGNFETLFIGWEFLGISSFLLISFYRDRYLPVRNSMKVVSYYRISDIALILAMWMSHHLWHTNVTFDTWNIPGSVAAVWAGHEGAGLFIAVAIVLAAAVKSAQIPFSAWLPRAMEGPTASSAIFYGALSVHTGVFLLLRTYPFWADCTPVMVLVMAIGVLSAVLANGMSQVQSTVKTQIAYASIAQIGLIFIEITMGWHILALVHFVGNAMLRTYQLLVSPSVLSYMTHNMFFHFKPTPTTNEQGWGQKIKNILFLLSLKEWNLDHGWYQFFWKPFKTLGSYRYGLLTAIVLIAGLRYWKSMGQDNSTLIAEGCMVLALAFLIKAFAWRKSVLHAWLMVFLSQSILLLGLMSGYNISFGQILLYFGGILLAAFGGLWALLRVKAMDQDVQLDKYHGHIYEIPGTGLVFLLCGLGVFGFPVTPSFVGIDYVFSQVGSGHWGVIALLAVNFLLLEITVLRMYARIFLGQHKKQYHPIAFKSS